MLAEEWQLFQVKSSVCSQNMQGVNSWNNQFLVPSNWPSSHLFHQGRWCHKWWRMSQFWEKTHHAELQELAELQNHSLSHQLWVCTFQIWLVLEHRILEGAGTPSPSCGVWNMRSSLSLGRLAYGWALVWPAAQVRKKITFSLPVLIFMYQGIWEIRRSASWLVKRKRKSDQWIWKFLSNHAFQTRFS